MDCAAKVTAITLELVATTPKAKIRMKSAHWITNGGTYGFFLGAGSRSAAPGTRLELDTLTMVIGSKVLISTKYITALIISRRDPVSKPQIASNRKPNTFPSVVMIFIRNDSLFSKLAQGVPC